MAPDGKRPNHTSFHCLQWNKFRWWIAWVTATNSQPTSISQWVFCLSLKKKDLIRFTSPHDITSISGVIWIWPVFIMICQQVWKQELFVIHGAPTATDLLLLLLFSSNFTFSFFEYVLHLLLHRISETKRRKEDKKLHTALFWDSVIKELVVYTGSVQLQFSRSTIL